MSDENVVYVFQYGSNMSTSRMQEPTERIPEAKPVEAAWTVDPYEFCFPIRSRKSDRAVSGITKSESGRKIFGVLYAIPADLLDRKHVRPGRASLDEIEGEGRNYRRTTIRVVRAGSGEEIEAVTYLPNPQENPGYTDEEYAGYIRAGLSEWNAPQDYVQYVEGVIVKSLANNDG